MEPFNFTAVSTMIEACPVEIAYLWKFCLYNEFFLASPCFILRFMMVDYQMLAQEQDQLFQ